MSESTTIVSAFIYLSSGSKSLEFYVEQGVRLLQLDIPKIIFIDEQVFSKFEGYQNSKTTLIKTRLHDLYLYKYKDKDKDKRPLQNPRVNTDNPTKDTFEYFVIQCNKTEWIREAINKTREMREMNRFKQFIWLDFGIHHVLPHDITIASDSFLQDLTSNKVRIPSIWDLETDHGRDCKRDILWYFAGGVFGGPVDALLQFANLTRAKCLAFVEETRDAHLMWEVNIWYLVWQENRDLFDPYRADHNASIILKYKIK